MSNTILKTLSNAQTAALDFCDSEGSVGPGTKARCQATGTFHTIALRTCKALVRLGFLKPHPSDPMKGEGGPWFVKA